MHHGKQGIKSKLPVETKKIHKVNLKLTSLLDEFEICFPLVDVAKHIIIVVFICEV